MSTNSLLFFLTLDRWRFVRLEMLNFIFVIFCVLRHVHIVLSFIVKKYCAMENILSQINDPYSYAEVQHGKSTYFCRQNFVLQMLHLCWPLILGFGNFTEEVPDSLLELHSFLTLGLQPFL